jgi:hypothetical protein
MPAARLTTGTSPVRANGVSPVRKGTSSRRSPALPSSVLATTLPSGSTIAEYPVGAACSTERPNSRAQQTRRSQLDRRHLVSDVRRGVGGNQDQLTSGAHRLADPVCEEHFVGDDHTDHGLRQSYSSHPAADDLAAFPQESARRLLGWSSVSQAGYLLMAVAVAGRSDLALPSLALYLAAYAVTNLGAFAVTAALPDAHQLAHYRGLVATRPALALSLLVLLLGLVGTPPTAVFVGKLTVFAAALDGGLAWLVAVGAVNTVASLYYYLRWLGPALSRTSSGQAAPLRVHPIAMVTAVVAATASVLLGIGSGAVLALLD